MVRPGKRLHTEEQGPFEGTGQDKAPDKSAPVRQGNLHLINNRQGGRRRGRGGQRPQGAPGNSGNARDNRQRGNAAQLLEKYKNMARDSQLSGDRVQTEYYLQFADHYFRMLGETRVRFEEQRRQHGDDEGDDDGEELVEAEGDGEFEAEERQPRRHARGRDDRPEREDRPERPAARSDREDRPEREARSERAARPDREERPERRPAGNGRGADNSFDDGQRMPFDALPPAIGAADESATSDESEPVRPARRPRRARPTDNDGEGAAA